ncbi:hypothetical protein PPERSA_01548 [Pseudocohnilembus persalinus]|uniref:RING-type domain-containing protein n=1 Tax=Pseudocohnilembus persalinus TaxID=266149 RepID=A0A0V0QHM1_PSEPJ|nr:hypothetical protein PPERSA_01548 [Pseudocohnilembus persalinus]|eukprot:KRX01678.1 hypothetical protein PPERSA_01548 [Pseudocohnilembus persalinus]
MEKEENDKKEQLQDKVNKLKDIVNLLSADKNAMKFPSFVIELYDILKELSQNGVQLGGQITGIVKECIFCKKDIEKNNDINLFQHKCGKVYHVSCIQQMELDIKATKNINCINKIDEILCINDGCKKDMLQQLKLEFLQHFTCYCQECQNYTQIQPKKDRECAICSCETKNEDFIETNYEQNEKCNHKACYDCVIQYLKSKGDDINQIRKKQDNKDDDQEQLGMEISCFGGCGEIMDLHLVQSWGSDGNQEKQNIHKQINQILEKLQKQLWSNVLFKCPGCENQISVSNKIKNVTCVNCGKTYCAKCLQPQHQNNCNEIDKIQVVINSQPPIDDFDAIFNKIINKDQINERDIEECLEQCQKWRYCCKNGCGTFFTKDKGCNHIKCQSCQTDQCFVCSAPRQQILSHGNHYHRLDCPDSQNDKKASIQQRQKTQRKTECKYQSCKKNDENLCIREGHYCLSCRKTEEGKCCEPPQDEYAKIFEQNIKNIGLEEKAITDKFEPIQLEAFKFKLGISNKINNKELSMYFYERNWQLMQSYIKDKKNDIITNFLTEDIGQRNIENQSLSERQIQKQLSQKLKKQQNLQNLEDQEDDMTNLQQKMIHKMGLKNQDEKLNLINNRHEDGPQFLTVALGGLALPLAYFFFKTGFSPFFSATHTNSICMIMDWTGISLAAFTGSFFFYKLFRHQFQEDKQQRKAYINTIVGINMTGILGTLYLIQDLNIFAVMPMVIAALLSMPLKFQCGDILAVHKNLVGFYFKYTLLFGFSILMAVMSQISFQNFKTKMNNEIQELNLRAKREFEESQQKEQIQQQKQEEQEQNQNKKSKKFLIF